MGAGNQTQGACKTSKPSELPSHLSSHRKGILKEFLSLNHVSLCTYLLKYACNACGGKGQKRGLHLLDLETKLAVSCLLRSFVR